mmetsp:Transcript_75112/g.200471  ORF Transcript_75112/g.200471 Transcript_75112/m.200471 type:complete len:174 (-) Transcript_75112:18-539(-)
MSMKPCKSVQSNVSWKTVGCVGVVALLVAADQLMFTMTDSLELLTGSSQLMSHVDLAGSSMKHGNDALVVGVLVAVVLAAVCWGSREGVLEEMPEWTPKAECESSVEDFCMDDEFAEGISRGCTEPCLRWNEGACKARPGSCRFGHFCNACGVVNARHRAGSRACPHARPLRA